MCIRDRDDGQPLDRHVVDHVVEGALHEGRIDIAEGDDPRGSQSGREGHGMSFGDPDVETAPVSYTHLISHFGPLTKAPMPAIDLAKVLKSTSTPSTTP